MSDPRQTQPAVFLFKIVTIRDEIVIGFAPEQLSALGGRNAGAIGKALSRDGELTAWQFTVRRREDGALEQAPLRQVSILGHESIRVEPYTTPLPVLSVPPDAAESAVSARKTVT